MTDFGIDISHHNLVHDWHAVRGNNITFVSVKLTESVGFTDPAASGHVQGARTAGIHTGGYHFARNADVGAQVDHFATCLRSNGLLGGGSLAPMLDMEVRELRQHGSTFVPDFVHRLRARTGVTRVLVYASLDWWTNVLRPDEWADPDIWLWIARPNGKPGQPGWAHSRLVLHQHSFTGTVPGIPAHVDRDATVGPHSLSDVLVGG
jgi:GH25 family lysozyme M1 (1,4-beta-N-acetylmuramidase)